VQIGVCASPAHLDDVVRYGFGYLEPAAAAIAAMDETTYQDFKSRVRASPVRCLAFNSFIRQRELKVVGDTVPRLELIGYMEEDLQHCSELGGQVVVWGSAGSRNVPPGFSRARAWNQIADFLWMAGDIAQPKGLFIAIEPLRRQESNILNTGAEALRMVRQVRHPNVKMIIDYYHLSQERESPEILWEARKEIVHFHFANPHGRVWPRRLDEDAGYPAFFAQLRRLVTKAHWRGGLSIEARGSFAQDAAASLQFFRRELGPLMA
jgi:sugar phosphate isomerase/epimerase